MTRMTNLYNETVDVLKRYGKSVSDCKWIDVPEGIILLNEQSADPILKQLFDFDYDAGYGAPEIRSDLKVVGDDWWLERHEYDGSEWWEYKCHPSTTGKVVLDPKTLKIVSD